MTNGEENEYNYSGDKLLSFNNKECEYDALGNPTTYLDKKASWSHISNLRRLVNVSFDYNASGMRTSKSKGSNKIKYYYAGDKLLAESRYIEHNDFPDDIDEGYSSITPKCDIQYLYGINGITGFRLRQAYATNWTDYYYRKNLQGDVTHIINNNNVVAKYVYDAWGNHEVVADVDGIAELNPIRYRGYYYDTETGLYYLKSRYYDPETGRFLNMDDISYLQPGRINGLNLYAYCINNPVMYIDPSGHFGIFSWFVIGIISVVILTGALKGAESAKKAADSGKGFFETTGAFFTGLGEGIADTTVTIGTGVYNNIAFPFYDRVLKPAGEWIAINSGSLSEFFSLMLPFTAGIPILNWINVILWFITGSIDILLNK